MYRLKVLSKVSKYPKSGILKFVLLKQPQMDIMNFLLL